MKINCTLLLFLFFPQLAIFQPQVPILNNCRLHIQDSTFQLNSLSSPDGWNVRDLSADSGLFSMQYMFNFCKQVAQPCKGESVPAFEVLTVMGQVTDTCEIIGRDRDINAKYIDEGNKNKGFKLTYGSGDICQNSENPIENGQPRKVNYKVMCSEKQDSNWLFSPINSRDITKCNLEFSINSPAGCLPGYSSSGSSSKKLAFFIIILLIAYFGTGIAYNIKVNSLSGKDALPHKEFWQDVPQLAVEGAIFLKQKAINIKEKISGQEASQHGGYNTL